MQLATIATAYSDAGFIPFTVSVAVDSGKKVIKPPSKWSSFTRETPGRVKRTHNGLALRTGEAGGLFVLDVDGLDSWMQYLSEHDHAEPETCTQNSQSGGKHYFFQWETRFESLKSTSKVIPGLDVDVRSTGGMIVCFPTTVGYPDGVVKQYTWVPGKALVGGDRCELGWMPEWLWTELSAHQAGTGARVGKKNAGPSAPPSVSREAVPPKLVDFIVEHYGFLPHQLEKVLYKAESGTFIVQTKVKECPFYHLKKHSSNHQYFVIKKSGGISRQCHDGDCKGKQDGPREVDPEILRGLEEQFGVPVNEGMVDIVARLGRGMSVENMAALSRKFGIDEKAEWKVEDNKLIPQVYECLVKAGHIHTSLCYSCLLLNNKGTAAVNCPLHGMKVLKGSDATQVFNVLNISVTMSAEDKKLKTYNTLTEDVCVYAQTLGLRKEKNTGVVYRPVNDEMSYAYERWKDPEDFLREVFRNDNQLFNSSPCNIDDLCKYLKSYHDYRFDWIEPHKDYLGFPNGVLNVVEARFIPLDSVPADLVVRKYIACEFTGSTETPNLDRLLDLQFDPETKEFIWMALGRLFGIRDNWGFMLFLRGAPGTGKSKVLEIMTSFFERCGAIGSTFESKFGLSALYDQEIVVCDDVPQDINRILNQETLQSMITGGNVQISSKNKTSFLVRWNVPILFAGNYSLGYRDKGQMSRRVMEATFTKVPECMDTTIKERVISEELPALALKVSLAYREAIRLHGSQDVWAFAPQYFKDSQQEARMEQNPLLAFIVEHCEYQENGILGLSQIKAAYERISGATTRNVDHESFKLADPRYEVKPKMVCSKCRGPHQKGCCAEYDRSRRTNGTVVINIKIAVCMGEAP